MNAVSNGMGQAIGSALASAAEANQVLTDMRLRGNGVDSTAIRRMQAALSYLDISKSLGEDAGLDCDEQGAGLAWTTRSTMAEFDIADPSDDKVKSATHCCAPSRSRFGGERRATGLVLVSS